MFKFVLTHQIMPGKGQEVLDWFKRADAERKKANPSYVPPKRYATVFGNRGQIVMEWEMEDPRQADGLWEEQFGLASNTRPEQLGSILVPGMSTSVLLKELDLG
jgi:hypothetical protein